MSKSVYSLVLTDEIVRAIDSLAYRMNTSRSALIDRILAEKLSMQTPEIRMRNIMENISSFFDDEIFRLQTVAGDGGMLIKSPLPYKYKPTIRYSVELLREDRYLGRLKVSFRTQNMALMTAGASATRILSQRLLRIMSIFLTGQLSSILKMQTTKSRRFRLWIHFIMSVSRH